MYDVLILLVLCFLHLSLNLFVVAPGLHFVRTLSVAVATT